ncbi:MAG: NIPSNAP family protein [candidate division Zixibacteria bacterium]|nr:NIPSNAP family protein [candidate division Zixibacteria bacterium]
MIYEERIYKIMPGRIPDILKRFTNHALPLFERHGMKLVGFWTTSIGPSNHELIYLMAYESLDERDRQWTAFAGDPDWVRAKAESEANGPLVVEVSNRILKPTTFSPMQ